MARVDYDSSAPMGALTQAGVNGLIEGRETLIRLRAAAAIASDNGADPALLEGGAFGVAPGQGDAFWSAIVSITDLLTTADNGGYSNFLGSIDNGG